MPRLFPVGPRKGGLDHAATNAMRIGTRRRRRTGNAYSAPSVRVRLRLTFTCRVRQLLIRSVSGAGYVLMVIPHSSSALPVVMLCVLPVMPGFSLQILRG